MANNKDDWQELPLQDDWEEVPSEYVSPGVSDKKSFLQNVGARISDPNQYLGMLGMGPAANKKVVAGTPSLVIPEASAPAAISKLAQFLGKTRVRRIATGTALGAASDPSHPGKGAIKGALFATGAEALPATISAVGSGGRWVGGKLAGLKPHQAKAFQQSPQLAEEMATKLHADPRGFEQQALAETEGALGKLQATEIDPKIAELNQRIAGKQFEVLPEQYRGTAAAEEIARAQRASGNIVEAPYQKVNISEGKFTPVEPVQKYGPPEVTEINTIPGETAQIPVSVPYTQYAKAGPLQSSVRVNPGEIVPNPVEMPIPERVSISGPQLLRAKRASSRAAGVNYSKNPMGYKAADDIEAQAAVRLNKAMEGRDPAAASLNEALEQDLRLSETVRRMQNPSQIFQSGESIGNVPIRSIQQRLDQATGSQFAKKAAALEAGKATYSPGRGTLEDLLFRPAGRAILRSTPMPENVVGNAIYGSPLITRTGEPLTLEELIKGKRKQKE